MQRMVYQGKMTDEKLISHDNLLMGEKKYIISNTYHQDNKYAFGKESTMPGLDANYKTNAKPGQKQVLA